MEGSKDLLLQSFMDEPTPSPYSGFTSYIQHSSFSSSQKLSPPWVARMSEGGADFTDVNSESLSNSMKHRFKYATPLSCYSPLVISTFLVSTMYAGFLYAPCIILYAKILASFLHWANNCFQSSPHEITCSPSVTYSFIHLTKSKHYPLWGTMSSTAENTKMN